jgi:hypothetical protein
MQNAPFDLRLHVKGTGSIQQFPLARELHTKIDGLWVNPGFDFRNLQWMINRSNLHQALALLCQLTRVTKHARNKAWLCGFSLFHYNEQDQFAGANF